MRTVRLALGLTTALVALALSSTLAIAGPGAKANGPKTKSTAAKPAKVQGASSTKAKGPSAKPAASAKTKPVKSTTTKPGNAKKTQPTTTASTATSSTSTSSTSTSTTTDTTDATTTTWKPTNAVSQKLVTKPNLLQKAKAVLPANTDLNLATAGFKNFGQFNAAINVSQNLHIDFAELKLRMTGIPLTGTPTGTTGTPAPTMSLGQAIHDIRGDVDATTEAQKATTQAEIESGERTTTTASATPTSSKTKKSK
jgi:hypothetical protein